VSGAALILTATDRLARALREDENLARRAEGRSVWEAPEVRSLHQWLQDAWADSWPTAQLLDSTQTLALWLDAVERDRRGVIGAGACAREAREADRLAQDYGIEVSRWPAWSEDQRAWRAWRERVHRRLRERDWLSGAQLPALVAAGLRADRIAAPERIRLVGFHAGLAPAEREVIEALRARSLVEQAPAAPVPAPLRGWRTDDANSQCLLIAQAVRQRLARCSGSEDAPPRIVVVLPDPDGRRALLEQALSELLAPWLRMPGEPALAPWRWDAGRALSERPWTDAVLALAALEAENNTPQAISRVLLAPSLWPGAARAAAAALDARLRDEGLPRIALDQLPGCAPPLLRGRLEKLVALIAAAPTRALPSAWSAQFRARLELLGWPGAETLPSSAFQLVRELRRELARLATLDAQTGSIDAGRARMWLGELCKRRFEPRAEHSQPVQILAPEDAQGLPCELLILADAEAGQFPGSARRTPFLPIEAQRAAGVPSASPEAWLVHRRALLASLLAGAGEALAIAPKVDERGSEVLASPLLDCAWEEAPARRLWSLGERLAQRGPHTQLPEHDPVPPVAAAEDVHGDARLFALFAEAPFFAFCTHRLGVQPLPEPARGLSGSVQGTLLHDALNRIWATLGDSAGLAALDAASLDRVIADALRPLLAQRLPEPAFGRGLVRLEAARLHDVLRQWFDHERRRADAFAVIAREQELDAALAGLPLKLRIDRIDRVQTASGPRLLILDYKTGREADPRGWRADALREPQLPLYAVLLRQTALTEVPQVDGIAFAHLKDGHPALSPLTNWTRRLIDGNQPVSGEDWPQQLAAWRERLETCAREFLAGRADIDLPAIAARSFNAALLDLAGESEQDGASAEGGGE
jgi:probable DNA repair protein